MADAKAQKIILLVDDDTDFLLQNRLQLQAAGYQVLTAETQVEAERIIARDGFDLAVVDLMLEYHDSGFVLSHHIKKKNPRIPVILVTAVTSETGLEFDSTTIEERSWIKADRVLAKPIRFEQLYAEIQKLLKG